MNKRYVLTVMAEDAPGLVQTISSIVVLNDGNWLESRMCRLGGKFAGILQVLLPEEMETAFLGQLKQLEFRGIRCDVSIENDAGGESERKVVALELLGTDRPGIVNTIAKAINALGINVEELETTRYAAPMSGELLFKANASLFIPEGCDVQSLRHALETIANDLMVDISLD